MDAVASGSCTANSDIAFGDSVPGDVVDPDRSTYGEELVDPETP